MYLFNEHTLMFSSIYKIVYFFHPFLIYFIDGMTVLELFYCFLWIPIQECLKRA